MSRSDHVGHSATDSEPLNASPILAAEATGVPSKNGFSDMLGSVGGRLGVFAKANIGLVLLLILLLAGGILSPVFLTPRNIYYIMWAVSILGVAAMGQTILIITRNFDLSVGMVASFAGIVCVGAQIAGWGLLPSIIAGLLAGLGVGLL